MKNGKIFEVTSGSILDAAFTFICRHLVGLCTSYQVLDKSGKSMEGSEPLIYSATVLSVRGVWCLLTAGHILRDIEGYLKEPRIMMGPWCLIDDFGPGEHHEPVPFDMISAPRAYVDDDEEGLDFGLVVLSDYYRKLLEANSVVPISEENWIAQSGMGFETHIMLGLPSKFIEGKSIGGERTSKILVSRAPTMILVQELRDAPADIKKTTYPRFIGKIDDKCPLDDIDGMSGGPILGFERGTNNAYWIVAIQSAWLKKKNIILACPVPVLARYIETKISEYASIQRGNKRTE